MRSCLNASKATMRLLVPVLLSALLILLFALGLVVGVLLTL
jgi:hypothetical protein